MVLVGAKPKWYKSSQIIAALSLFFYVCDSPSPPLPPDRLKVDAGNYADHSVPVHVDLQHGHHGAYGAHRRSSHPRTL